MLSTSACVTFTEVDKDGRIIVHQLGYSSVNKTSNERLPIYTEDATYIGLSSRNGVTLGYKNHRQVNLELDCRALIVVSNVWQSAQVAELIKRTYANPVCTAIVGHKPDNDGSANRTKTSRSHHFGYSNYVLSPHYPPDKNIVAIADKHYGISVGHQSTIGYQHQERIYAAPECELLVVVQDTEQFTQIKNAIQQLQGERLCVTMQTH